MIVDVVVMVVIVTVVAVVMAVGPGGELEGPRLDIVGSDQTSIL